MLTFCVIEFSENLTYLCNVKDMAEKIFEFPSVVRGFHYYRKYWQPQLDDELYCQHELDNPFNFFTTKICVKNTGVTVGHLPMEISRAMKFHLYKSMINLSYDSREKDFVVASFLSTNEEIESTLLRLTRFHPVQYLK